MKISIELSSKEVLLLLAVCDDVLNQSIYSKEQKEATNKVLLTLKNRYFGTERL